MTDLNTTLLTVLMIVATLALIVWIAQSLRH